MGSRLPPEPDGASRARPRKPRLRAPGAGRPRKARSLHVLHGTTPTGRRPTRSQTAAARATAEISSAVPSPPDWLDPLAAEYWRAEAPRLVASGRLLPHYLAQFEMLCSEYSIWRRALKGIPKRIRGKAFPPAAAIAGRARAAYAALALRFGLDPASDARLGEMAGGGAAAGGTPEPETRDDAWHREFGGAGTG